MTHPKLEIKNLSKHFTVQSKHIPVLDNITFTVYPGEFVTIIGPSGCGKSTLFHCIAGIEKQSSGTIRIDTDRTEKRLGKSGYMLQKPLLLPWNTVIENVMLGLRIQHVPEKKAKAAAESVLETFGLREFSHYYPYTLSGGMAQRIALLRTILYNHDMLLMDEPFGALDALTRLSMQMWLQNVLKQFTSTVLLITHDIHEAILLSDRIYVVSMRPARIVRTINVPFARPRKREFLTTKEAISHVQTLEQLLLTL